MPKLNKPIPNAMTKCWKRPNAKMYFFNGLIQTRIQKLN